MKSKSDTLPDLTPSGRLAEGAMAPILGYQLAQASVTTNRVFDAVMGDGLGLRPVEFTILALIDANPQLTAGQLARALAVTPPNITAWLEKLESRGLIERERSTTDRRSQHVRASEPGRRIVAEAARRLVEAERAALASLTNAERLILLELLHKVATCRRQQQPPRGQG